MNGFDPDEISPAENKRIIQSAVSPRPIAWISTVDEDGVDNLAPFSSYNYVSNGGKDSAPPILLFNSPTDERLKDTARNALETEEFAVNLVTESLIEEMDATSAVFPPGETEFEHADVTPAPCLEIDASRVEESPLTMECVLFDTVEHYNKLMILGEVVHYHIHEDIMEDGKIEMERFSPVGRLGGPYYTIGDIADFQRQH
jgi:flavin reductase (DIM6/NTAB) family NADH-FMN oxidoreductase RutF